MGINTVRKHSSEGRWEYLHRDGVNLTIKEALTGKVTSQQRPAEVGRALKTPGGSVPSPGLASAKVPRHTAVHLGPQHRPPPDKPLDAKQGSGHL